MSEIDATIIDNVFVELYNKGINKCNGRLILKGVDLTIEDFIIAIADNGGIQVFMPKDFGTTWPHAEIISWKEVRLKFKTAFEKEYNIAEMLKLKQNKQEKVIIEIENIRSDNTCDATAKFSDGTVISGFSVIPANNGGLQIFMPKAFGTSWPFDGMISWEEMRSIIKKQYILMLKNEETSTEIKKTTRHDFSLKFHGLNNKGTCFANCHFKTEDITINNFILRFSNIQMSVDMPNGINEWQIKSISWDDFKVFVIEKFKKFVNKMGIDLQAFQDEGNANTDEIWAIKKRNIEISLDKSETPVIVDWRKLLGAHNSLSGISPLAFVPNTVLRLEEYIERYELLKEEKRTKKGASNYKSNIPIDFLISALKQNDFIGPFELDVLTWINKLRYVTTSMLMDLYISGYIAPTWRKITKDKFSTIINRMQKYNLVNVTRFASLDDTGRSFESKAVSRIYTLGKNGNILLRQLGRESMYNAFDIYQDGNVVKGYMAANQHLVRWLSSFPAYVKNNYDTTQVIHSFGTKKIGARIYGVVKCGRGTIIIEPVRRTDRWSFDESNSFLKDKLTRIITLISNIDELYHRSVYWGSSVKFELNENPIICYTCEDEAHMKEVWEMIKPIALENPTQKIWFTHDLNIYNDSAEGKRYVEFSEDDTYSIVDMHKLFDLGKERDYDFLYNS